MLTRTDTLRIAGKLQRIGAARPAPTPDSGRMERNLDELVAEVRRAEDRVRLAGRYRLDRIGPALRSDVSDRLDHLARASERFSVLYRTSIPPVPDLRHWFEEIRQLEAEFGTVTIRWTDQVLRVVTEPIVLEGIALGPFAIEFGWDASRRFRGARAFEVMALEPNPAAGRDEIVHPHVEGRRLCSGEATEPLHRAVDQGRLVDAFLLVQSVLANYNSNSPYVALAEWDGFRCANCADRARARDRSSCEGCDGSLCRDCSHSCSRCSETRCSDCLHSCAVCDDSFCRGCLVETAHRLICPGCHVDCPGCGARVATDEIDDDRCPACPELEPEEIANVV